MNAAAKDDILERLRLLNTIDVCLELGLSAPLSAQRHGPKSGSRAVAWICEA